MNYSHSYAFFYHQKGFPCVCKPNFFPDQQSKFFLIFVSQVDKDKCILSLDNGRMIGSLLANITLTLLQSNILYCMSNNLLELSGHD